MPERNNPSVSVHQPFSVTADGGVIESGVSVEEVHDLLYPSTGKFHYSDTGWKLIVEVDPEIARYYRSLIPKWLPAYPTRYAPHITVVRQEKETPVNIQFWKKYDGQPVDFLYDPNVQQGKVYYWLNIYVKAA